MLKCKTCCHTQQLEKLSLCAGILPPAMLPGESFAFTMCNPPFFDSMSEAGRNPRTNFGGSPEEMVTPGGELAFVKQMVMDSLQLKVCEKLCLSTSSPPLQALAGVRGPER